MQTLECRYLNRVLSVVPREARSLIPALPAFQNCIQDLSGGITDKTEMNEAEILA